MLSLLALYKLNIRVLSDRSYTSRSLVLPGGILVGSLVFIFLTFEPYRIIEASIVQLLLSIFGLRSYISRSLVLPGSILIGSLVFIFLSFEPYHKTSTVKPLLSVFGVSFRIKRPIQIQFQLFQNQPQTVFVKLPVCFILHVFARIKYKTYNHNYQLSLIVLYT